MAEVSITCYPCRASSPPQQGGPMAYASTAIVLSAEERGVLEKNVRAAKTEQRLAFRSRVVLLAAEGLLGLCGAHVLLQHASLLGAENDRCGGVGHGSSLLGWRACPARIARYAYFCH